MVARNFCVQQVPYAQLLQIPDQGDFLQLEEPKPIQMSQTLQSLPSQQYQPNCYEFQNAIDSSCSSSMQYQASTSCSSNYNSMMDLQNIDSDYTPPVRKRKLSYNEGSDGEDETGDDSKSIKTNDENKKQNHNEIEKRRRDKMNTYITELSSMVPMCHAMSRKLDKLTVLRLAVQHVKSIRGAIQSYTQGHYKPSFLSDQELKHLILQVADGFLFVVGCDRGRILYVSKSVSTILHFSQEDLLGQSWFDILHPKDVAKVKEQLSSSYLNPREKLIDAKTLLPVKTDVSQTQGGSRLCPGARRSFFCRMKCKNSATNKDESELGAGCRRKKTTDKRYSVIHCTGYLKSWAPAKMGLDEHEVDNDDSCNLSCLVAVGRILPHISSIASTVSIKSNLEPIQFVSRHALDGKFLFVDQRATLILGFLPQELLGTSMYEYYHNEDIHIIAECQKSVLLNSEKIVTNIYRFRTKENGYIQLQTEWKSFKNPWTKEIEYLIAKNILILTDSKEITKENSSQMDGLQENLQFFTESNGRDIHRLINSHVEVSKIGCQIAEQVLDLQRREGESPSDNSMDSEVLLTGGNCDQSHNNSNIQQLGFSARNETGNNGDDEIIEMIEDAVKASPANALSNDGNDEAAMAVIMSLLEADAGLGGPVDFSGLPWPLP